MRWRWRLTGVLLFAISVFFLLLAIYVQMIGGEQLTALTPINGFIGFLLIGLGLVLIFKRKIEVFKRKIESFLEKYSQKRYSQLKKKG
jgi:hypothetical protein